ncbi:MAG TPA: DUF192 domain-containing protein [Acidobacteriota bacterium]|jgi:hypothetical protein
MDNCVVVNKTKNAVLASTAQLAKTPWTRIKGLIGCSAEQFPPGKALWIMPSQGIHTIGMSFPIDVIYLDRAGRVVYACHRLPPFRIAAFNWRARSVIELPAGTLKQSSTSVGDEIVCKKNEGGCKLPPKIPTAAASK